MGSRGISWRGVWRISWSSISTRNGVLDPSKSLDGFAVISFDGLLNVIEILTFPVSSSSSLIDGAYCLDANPDVRETKNDTPLR